MHASAMNIAFVAIIARDAEVAMLDTMQRYCCKAKEGGSLLNYARVIGLWGRGESLSSFATPQAC